MIPRKNLYIMLCAAGLAAVGVYFANAHIQKTIAAAQLHKPATAVKKPLNLIALVGLTQGVSPGTTLAEEIIKPIRVPPEVANQFDYVRWQAKDSIIGRRILAQLPANAGIRQSELSTSDLLFFSEKLRPNERAMTIPADAFNSIYGYLQPQDRIDLLLISERQDNSQAVPLVHNIEVLATDLRIEPDLTQASIPNSGEISTVTLRVNQIQAQRIALALEHGHLVVLLRNAQDTSQDRSSKTALSALFPKSPTGSKPSVDIILGGQ